MKQYFIGINKRSEDLIIELMALGCTLIFYYHHITMKLNLMYEFYDGEWLFASFDNDSEIARVKNFLEQYKLNDGDLKFAIISN